MTGSGHDLLDMLVGLVRKVKAKCCCCRPPLGWLGGLGQVCDSRGVGSGVRGLMMWLVTMAKGRAACLILQSFIAKPRRTLLRTLHRLGLAVLMFAVWPGAGQAQQLQPAQLGPEVRLADNVFVVPDPAAKSITGWLIIRAGCADEDPSQNPGQNSGQTPGGDCRGIAHYLEHLLFINRDTDHTSKVSAFVGGSGNGSTNMKSTWYTQRFPANPATDLAQTEKLIAYLSALLVEVKVEPAQAERERNIVLQEITQRSANPFARFGTKFNRALQPDEALGMNVGGTPEMIKAFSTEAAVKFHRRWYARNNATLVLHGPLDPVAIKPMVDRHFLKLATREVPANLWRQPRDYGVSSNRLDATDKEARQTAVYVSKLVSYDVPADARERRRLNAARALVSSFLASKFTGSPSDVLQEQNGLIASGGISVSKVRDGTLQVTFSGGPTSGVTADAVIEAAQAYIKGLSSLTIPAATQARLLKRFTSGSDLRRQEPDKYAAALVSAFVEHSTYDDWLDQDAIIASTTAAHVQTILTAIGQPGREVVGVLQPVAGQAVQPPPPRIPPESATGELPPPQ
jgi:zinc protease